MRVKRSDILLAPLCALAISASPTHAAANGVSEQALLLGGGIALAQLTAWPSQSVAELVARSATKAEHLATPKAVTFEPVGQAAPLGILKVDELLASAPMSVTALLALAEAQMVVPAAPASATSVPVATSPRRRSAAKAPLTVEVIISDDPQALPQAKITAAGVPSLPVPSGQNPAGKTLARVSPPTTLRATLIKGKTAASRLATVVIPPALQAAAPAPAVQALLLEVNGTASGLKFKPETLAFPKAGGVAKIQINGKGMEGLSFFVRDEKVAEFRKVGLELHSRQKGVTELYAVSQGHMYIVPVTVGAGGNPTDWDLKVPDALVSLEGVFQGSMKSALYPGLEQATVTYAAAGPGTGHANTVATDTSVLATPSLKDSVAETAAAMLRQAREAERFYSSDEKLGYEALTLQVVDDRTDVAAGLIYPVAAARVHLVGTEFTAETDNTGHLVIRDMPRRSRFLVQIDDPSGAVRPAMAELATQGDGSIVRIRMMRSFAFEAYSTIAGVTPHAALASYCATVTDGTQDNRLQAGVSVAIDVQGQGPFYFNAYGFLDRSMTATGDSGRFCFLNVAPGPAALTLYQDQAPVTTLPVSLFPGRHSEDAIDLGREATLTTRLASMPTAQELLSNDARLSSTFKSIDMIDLIPLGTTDPMMQVGPGLVQTNDSLVPHHGRLRAYAQAAEFEAAVYSYQEGDAQSVTPLMPRGFVEDMSLYAQVTHDPSLGAVLAEYATPAGLDHEVIAMRLVDEHGRDIGDGWYFGDDPVTKAIFFNVPAGTYSLLVETKDGYWLGADTVIVYNETVSYTRMGSELRYRP